MLATWVKTLYCFLGITLIPREIEDNDYAKFWGLKKMLMDAKMVNVTKEWFRQTGYFTLIWMYGFNIGKQVVGKSSFKCLIKVWHLLKAPCKTRENFLSFYVKSVLINPAIFKFLLCARDRYVFPSKPLLHLSQIITLNGKQQCRR